MDKFGQIKSNIESLMTKSYGKNSFKTNMRSFKSHIIKNEKLTEAYFLYDELSKKKGLSKDIVDDYVNECIEKIKDILTTESTKLKEVNMWVSENLEKETINQYSDIDTVVYINSVRKLEEVLECKNNIKKLLGETKEVLNKTETINRINESEISLTSLYKLKQLEQGL